MELIASMSGDDAKCEWDEVEVKTKESGGRCI
jgi:hypothetical protein